LRRNKQKQRASRKEQEQEQEQEGTRAGRNRSRKEQKEQAEAKTERPAVSGTAMNEREIHHLTAQSIGDEMRTVKQNGNLATSSRLETGDHTGAFPRVDGSVVARQGNSFVKDIGTDTDWRAIPPISRLGI